MFSKTLTHIGYKSINSVTDWPAVSKFSDPYTARKRG